MIKRLLTAGIALAALATAAAAADLPAKTTEPDFEPPPPIPVFSWTGLYAGLQAGYGFGRDAAALRGPAAGAAFFVNDPHGIIGGAHAGANYAVPAAIGAAHLVLGVQADVDGADDRHATSPYAGMTASTSSDIKGSARGRIGVAVNRVLFYATGGAAFAEFDTTYAATASNGAAAFDRTRTGYTVGGGVEYAFMNTMSVRAEYRYSNYGTFVDQIAASSAGSEVTVAHKETDNRIQAGISYRFDSILPAPVAARD